MKLFRNLYTLLAVTALTVTTAHAVEPAGYYSGCENKGGASLLNALCSTVGPHTTVSYDGLKTLYKTSDIKANGKLWDMYSTKEWDPSNTSQQCGNYKLVGDCWNREHSFPKSWFNDATPMYSDAFHLYPTDGKVNGQRSNYPYGECANGTTLPSNGSVKALGRLGNSTFAGYSDKVFEPDDEYKGDFARSYFYMAAAYNDRIKTWSSPMLAGNAYPAFSGWAIELLLKWHRQDPVSDKELNRQEAVYAAQKNRNPFIDHPEMVEYIWGDKKTQVWTSAAGAQPAITSPVSGSTIDFGTVGVGVARKCNVAVKGSALKNNIAVSVTGTGYTVTPSSLQASAVNSTGGSYITITLVAPAKGTFSGSLKLTSGDVTTTVALTANALDGLPATAPTSITDESFVAHWTYVGNADANGCYRLVVKDADGNDVDTYPRSVKADEEEYLVDELEAETEYSYYIECESLRSNVIHVTTAAPIPSIQIMYDGDLELAAEPGVPSEAAELLLDIENIAENITFTIDAPFQLSSDKGNWDTSLVVDPREDRIYIRIYSDKIGIYSSSIRATAGDYFTDEAEVTGHIADEASFVEDFEAATTGNYTTTTVTGTACNWTLSNAGVFEISKEAFSGKNYLRFGKNADSYAEMADDKAGGIGTVTLYASGWSSADGSTKFDLEYSADGGNNWETVGSAEIASPSSSTTKEYHQYTFTVNKTGNGRLRIRQTYGQRFCVDDIAVTNYRSGVDDLTFGDEYGTGWDAYCADGRLVIELTQPATVTVYGVDGLTYQPATAMTAGTTHVALAPGLYIVAVGNSTRRVLVK